METQNAQSARSARCPVHLHANSFHTHSTGIGVGAGAGTAITLGDATSKCGTFDDVVDSVAAPPKPNRLAFLFRQTLHPLAIYPSMHLCVRGGASATRIGTLVTVIIS